MRNRLHWVIWFAIILVLALRSSAAMTRLWNKLTEYDLASLTT